MGFEPYESAGRGGGVIRCRQGVEGVGIHGAEGPLAALEGKSVEGFSGET